MKSKVVSVAYPTIPIIFVASVNDKRIPLHDTMGLAVTDLKGETKSQTTIIVDSSLDKTIFLLEGQHVDARRESDINRVVEVFANESGKGGIALRIESINTNIYSGSSDSGAAALVVGLNELFDTNFSLGRLAQLGNHISESAGRSVFGGMNQYIVSEGEPFGRQVASERELVGVRIFAMGFDYESRVSAQQIFDVCRTSPFWQMRIDRIPYWRREVEEGLRQKDWKRVFANAEENCANAHYLIENGNLRPRRKEMMEAVIAIEDIRKENGLPVYWTAGGGKVINAFSWEPEAEKVLELLRGKGQNPVEYKAAPGAQAISIE